VCICLDSPGVPDAAEYRESTGPVFPGSETILLVEDETDVRKLTRDILTQQGYNVLECASGQEALDCCANYRGPIHLVLMDVVMPGMTGTQLEETLRQRYPAIKFLFMTGYAEEEVVHHGRVDPVVTLLHKPFTPRTLTQKVRQVIDDHT